MSAAFMGVESNALAAIGKIVVAAGRLELVLAYVANEVGVIDPTGPASSVIRDLNKALRGALPGPLDALRPSAIDWLSRLREPLQTRHQAIHGVHMTSTDAAGMRSAVAFLMRKDEYLDVRVEELEEGAEMLAVLYTEGMNLFGDLRTANLSLKAWHARAGETH